MGIQSSVILQSFCSNSIRISEHGGYKQAIYFKGISEGVRFFKSIISFWMTNKTNMEISEAVIHLVTTPSMSA